MASNLITIWEMKYVEWNQGLMILS
jgi:hypothetical protein